MNYYTITYFFIYTFLFVSTTSLSVGILNSDTSKKLDSALTELHESGQFNGVILIADGEKILYKKALGKANFEWDVANSTDTRFRIASVTKTFTAALTLQLIEKGKISFTDVISDYLPEYSSEATKRITIEQLLTQSSGIPDYCSLPDFMDEVSLMDHDRYEFLVYFMNLDLKFEPGTDWSYGNSEYYLLGLIIEQATGMNYESAIKEYVLEPVGLENTGFIATDRVIERLASGYVNAETDYKPAPFIHESVCFSAGGMYSTVGDLYKWSQALFKKQMVLSKRYQDKMTTRKIEDYGYGVFIGEQNTGDRVELVYTQLGNIHGYSSQVSYFPGRSLTFVILDNTQQNTTEIYFNIRDILLDKH